MSAQSFTRPSVSASPCADYGRGMVRRGDILSPRKRIVLLAVVLILAPGIVLGYLGFRSIASRAEGLLTNYAATVVLVRDR